MCEKKKALDIFRLFCEVIIAICPLTLVKVNLDITVEAYVKGKETRNSY